MFLLLEEGKVPYYSLLTTDTIVFIEETLCITLLFICSNSNRKSTEHKLS